ncbi:MAG: SsrA-binding protein [Chloroflexota bacterium]|jgi:SsrA-binding protein|nr:SsrA-binding protein [Chloroflexota bacterium]
MTEANTRERLYATNRVALHEYHILETLEVGIALTGTEIKSVRAGRVNLRDAYAKIDRRELWLYNAHIAPYDQGNRYNHEPTRPRKLLAHTREIGKLMRQATESGVTLVPLRMYDRRGHVKVQLAVARGKRSYDKRVALAERDAKREIERAMKHDLP